MNTTFVLIAMMAFCSIVIIVNTFLMKSVMGQDKKADQSDRKLSAEWKSFEAWKRDNETNDENIHKMISEESSKDTQRATVSKPSPRRSA